MRSAFRFRSESLSAKNVFCDKRVNTSEPFVRDATRRTACLSLDADMLADLYRSTTGLHTTYIKHYHYLSLCRHTSYNLHSTLHTPPLPPPHSGARVSRRCPNLIAIRNTLSL